MNSVFNLIAGVLVLVSILLLFRFSTFCGGYLMSHRYLTFKRANVAIDNWFIGVWSVSNSLNRETNETFKGKGNDA